MRLPLWLASEQVRVLTLNDDEQLVAYAKEIHRKLHAHEVRAKSDFGADPIKAKIADAEKPESTPCSRSADGIWTQSISVRLHNKGPQGAKPKGEVVAEILAVIRERSR